MTIGLPLKSLASRGNSFAPALRTSTLSSKVHQTCLSSRRLVSSLLRRWTLELLVLLATDLQINQNSQRLIPLGRLYECCPHILMRGDRGVGRLLVNECKRRARRDGANILALTTTKINVVALKMYLKMGFRYHSAAPPVATVPAGLYLMSLKEGVYS